MSYDDVSSFANSWGLVYMMILFIGVCVYAFWPSNKDKFDEAAHMPLDEEN